MRNCSKAISINNRHGDWVHRGGDNVHRISVGTDKALAISGWTVAINH